MGFIEIFTLLFGFFPSWVIVCFVFLIVLLLAFLIFKLVAFVMDVLPFV